MHYKSFNNVIPLEITEKIFKYFNQETQKKHTMGMNKIQDPWNLDIIQTYIEPILKKFFNTKLENIGDNIYKHKSPYFPHTDTSVSYPSFNVLIPIKVEGEKEQKFCIFDQYVNDFSSGHTWVGNFYDVIKDFDVNKKRKFIYDDEIVFNKTGKDIEKDFFQNHLKTKDESEKMFHSCSGVALDFKPGNIIIFDSKYIHATGKMSCDWKVGLSLRFRGNFNQEV